MCRVGVGYRPAPSAFFYKWPVPDPGIRSGSIAVSTGLGARGAARSADMNFDLHCVPHLLPSPLYKHERFAPQTMKGETFYDAED